MIWSEVILVALVANLNHQAPSPRSAVVQHLVQTLKATPLEVENAWAGLVCAGFMDLTTPLDTWRLNVNKKSNDEVVRAVTLIVSRLGHPTSDVMVQLGRDAWAEAPKPWTKHRSNPKADGKVPPRMWWLRSDYRAIKGSTSDSVPCICTQHRGNRWCWVVFENAPAMNAAHTALAHGQAVTEQEALNTAFKQVPGGVCSEGLKASVTTYFRRLRVANRMSADPRVKTATPLTREVVYDRADREHLILRRSEDYVFVSQAPASTLENNLRDTMKPLGWRCDVQCHRISRWDLEHNGGAGNNRCWYWTRPWRERNPVHTCLTLLGLKLPCTEAEVQRAYRTLLKTPNGHPDHGGTSETFTRLKRAYDEALALVVKSKPKRDMTTDEILREAGIDLDGPLV